MNSNFYHDLPTFRQFEQFTESGNYQPLPADWVVVVADIKNSTKAIKEGFYKEVNLIGAASITQTMLMLSTQDIPFIFGGDGASLCIPEDVVETVSLQLGKLQTLARKNFDLDLRVAIIPIMDIREKDSEVLVAKLEITDGKCITLFRGGGLAEADHLAKTVYERYRIAEVNDNLDSLEGLSCRWSPVPTRKGLMISLLVVARTTDVLDTYRELIKRFRQVMGREIDEANPVQDNLEQYKSIFHAVIDESKYHQNWFSYSFFKRVLSIILAVLIFKHGFSSTLFNSNARNYRDSISEHSDFRKFDDTLRLIMDCTYEEFQQLNELLEKSYKDGTLYYGFHTSQEALMTCFVETTEQGGHLHFIDGGDSGLTMASSQLKMQMKSE